MSPPFSWSKDKPSKKSAYNSLIRLGFLIRSLLKMGDKINEFNYFGAVCLKITQVKKQIL
jgi:hypothetical protein